MASIDSLYDTLRTTIATYSRFSGKKEIVNPYSLEDNASTFMDNSWGLVIGSGVRSDRDNPVIDYSVTTVRSVSVVITRAVYDVHGIGIEVNETAKDLLLDAEELRDNFLNLSKFGVLKEGEQVAYEGDTGVNFVQGDKFTIINTQVDFTFEMVQTIN